MSRWWKLEISKRIVLGFGIELKGSCIKLLRNMIRMRNIRSFMIWSNEILDWIPKMSSTLKMLISTSMITWLLKSWKSLWRKIFETQLKLKIWWLSTTKTICMKVCLVVIRSLEWFHLDSMNGWWNNPTKRLRSEKENLHLSIFKNYNTLIFSLSRKHSPLLLNHLIQQIKLFQRMEIHFFLKFSPEEAKNTSKLLLKENH